MSMKVGDEMSGKQFADLNTHLSIASKFVSEITRTKTGFKLNLTFAGRMMMGVLPITIKNGSDFDVTSFMNGPDKIYQIVSPGNKIYFDNNLINFNIYLDNNKYSIYSDFHRYMNVWK